MDNFLEETGRLGPGPLYQFLWPTGNFSEPCLTLVKRLYTSVVDLPVLHTPTAGGKWLTPGQALYHDEEFSGAECLAGALVGEGLPLVCVSGSLRRMIFTFCVRSPEMVIPGAVRAQYCKAGKHRGLLDRDSGVVVLEYCHRCSIVTDEEAASFLVGLSLIPLADCGWGVFGRRGNESMFFGSELELKIFKGIPSKIVDRDIPGRLLERFESIAQLSSTNPCPVVYVLLVNLLSHSRPLNGKGRMKSSGGPRFLQASPA